MKLKSTEAGSGVRVFSNIQAMRVLWRVVGSFEGATNSRGTKYHLATREEEGEASRLGRKGIVIISSAFLLVVQPPS